MRTKLPQEETDAIINRLRTKRDNLLSELREEGKARLVGERACRSCVPLLRRADRYYAGESADAQGAVGSTLPVGRSELRDR